MNQQLDIPTNPFVFDTIQTEGLNPKVSGDITLLPTEQPINVSLEVDVTSNKRFVDLPKIQPSTATSTTSDTKQHNTNSQNKKQKAKKISGYSKNNVEPNITQQHKKPAEDTYMKTYQFGNEVRTNLTISFLHLTVLITCQLLQLSPPVLFNR